MSTQTAISNATQRRHALLRALGLVTLLMILTGFGVSRFPLAVYHGRAGSADELSALKVRQKALLALLEELDERYTKILAIDGHWENENTIGAGVTLMEKIKPMESAIVDMLNRQGNKPGNELDSLSINAFKNLMIAREMIWRLRTKFILPPPQPGGDPSAMEILMLRQEAKRIADGLDLQADALENTPVKGKFSSDREVEVQKTVKSVTVKLRSLANQLRSI